MKNVYIPLLIVWTIVIIFQQVAIHTYQAHANKQSQLIDTCEIALTQCVGVAGECVALVRAGKGDR